MTVGEGLAGLRVLVVDDDLDTLDVVRALLEAREAEVVTASSAAEALALIPVCCPDVVLSDLAMPGQDGYAFVRALRALPPESGARAPVVAVSAHLAPEDRQGAWAAGFQAFLDKPLEPRVLVGCVRWLRELAAHDQRQTERRRETASSEIGVERRMIERRHLINCNAVVG